jgi:hypothetical protein
MSKPLTFAQRIQAATAPVASAMSIPAPTKGWNARDEFDAMDPLDAVQLDNWFPDAGGVYIRNGYNQFSTGLGGTVETLAAYVSGSTNKFLAAAGGSIYDISSGGAVGAALKSGFVSNQWLTCKFLSRLFLVNGSDTAQTFDGTNVADSTFTGVTLNTLVGVASYQQRLFFWANSSTGFWYAPLNAITGALSFFDLAPFTPRGGNTAAITTLSYDGGNGVLDYICFLMSSGDVLVYSGNDPSLVSNFQLVGTYRMSPPVNSRAVTDYGGDSFVTTFDDHCTLQQMFTALRAGQMPPRSKISKAVQLAVQATGTEFGWQALYYPRGRSLIFNIPNSDGTFDQHVCNTGLPTQPWCRYVGMNASCFGLYNNLLYFGAAGGIVYLADSGTLDNLGAINAVAQQAWNKMGSPNRKRLTAVRPVVQSLGGLSYTFATGFDYQTLNITTPVVTESIGSAWDVSPWDTSPWSSEFTIDPRWRVSGGSGTALGFSLTAASTRAVAWMRTDVRLEGGNGL